jgi:hypothetical protein
VATGILAFVELIGILRGWGVAGVLRLGVSADLRRFHLFRTGNGKKQRRNTGVSPLRFASVEMTCFLLIQSNDVLLYGFSRYDVFRV